MKTVNESLSPDDVRIELEDPASSAAQHCINSYYQELATRFDTGFDPDKSISAAADELTPPRGYLLVARLHGKPVGCGALKCHTDFAEVKRMWVDAEARGFGIGRRLLQRLEEIARGNGIGLLRLETNQTLKEAQSLYRNSGYREVPAFNDEPYAHHWFEKNLQQ